MFPLTKPYLLIETMNMVMVLCEGAPAERLARLLVYWHTEAIVCSSLTLHDDTRAEHC